VYILRGLELRYEKANSGSRQPHAVALPPVRHFLLCLGGSQRLELLRMIAFLKEIFPRFIAMLRSLIIYNSKSGGMETLSVALEISQGFLNFFCIEKHVFDN